MRIVFSTQFYQDAVGGTLWLYDLAHEFNRRGHTVRIHAGAIGEIFQHTDENIIVSARNTVPYKPDIVIACHPMFSQALIENTEAPAISVCHSKVFDTDAPILHNRVKRQVVVDKDLVPFVQEKYGIDPVLIVNGIDMNRFRIRPEGKEYIFVPAAINWVRVPMVNAIIENHPKEQIMFMGYNTNSIPKRDNIIIKGQQWNIEDYYAKAKLVAGFVRGRVNYEAWACGIVFEAYQEDGTLVGTPPPPENFREEYSLEFIADKWEDLIHEVIGMDSVSYQKNSGGGISHHTA